MKFYCLAVLGILSITPDVQAITIKQTFVDDIVKMLAESDKKEEQEQKLQDEKDKIKKE